MQPLTTALGTYGLTKPLKHREVPLGRLTLDYIEIEPITAAMRRMCRGIEFDICEMAFTTYVCARALGKPFTAIPVFVTRNFHHWAVFINTKSGIREPEGPRRPQGRRQSRLYGHHRALGARHPADRIWRRFRQGHLDPDRR